MDDLAPYLRTMISLLARSSFGIERIHQLVTRGKRSPRAYVAAYNALDGSKGVTEVARIAGVTQPSMTVVLQGWEEAGIIVRTGSDRAKPGYMKLLTLPETLKAES